MKLLNLKDLFTQNLCSFEMAKRVKAAGVTSENTYFAYNEPGEITDAGWMDNQIMTMYPCINLAFAISMLEHTIIADPNEIGFADPNKIELSMWDNPDEEKGGSVYIFKYDGEQIAKEENLVDCILAVWLRFKK